MDIYLRRALKRTLASPEHCVLDRFPTQSTHHSHWRASTTPSLCGCFIHALHTRLVCNTHVMAQTQHVCATCYCSSAAMPGAFLSQQYLRVVKTHWSSSHYLHVHKVTVSVGRRAMCVSRADVSPHEQQASFIPKVVREWRVPGTYSLGWYVISNVFTKHERESPNASHRTRVTERKSSNAYDL